jgi:rhamnosyl/mannosyltransferase
MKILQIGKYFPPYYYGGIETVSYNLHNALLKKNIDIDFLGFLPKGIRQGVTADNRIYLCKTDIDIFSASFSYSFISVWKKIRSNYDIILINMPNPFANVIIKFFPPIKGSIILYWHSDIIKQKILLQFYKPFLISLIKKSVAVIAPTAVHLDQSDFSSYFYSKKYILPYILNVHFKKLKAKLYDGKKVIFSCGRLIYYKGFFDLIEAAVMLPENCIIKIAGDGILREKLQKKITGLQLSKKIILLGKITDHDLEKELGECYLFCLPSNYRSEMFGVVQVEAFAHGKPVVSTNIPRSGVSEVNIDNKTGYTVEINNPQAIANAIKKLIENESIYNEFSNNAFEHANDFINGEIINKYIVLFQKYCNQTF